jgi:hypothetical protein
MEISDISSERSATPSTPSQPYPNLSQLGARAQLVDEDSGSDTVADEEIHDDDNWEDLALSSFSRGIFVGDRLSPAIQDAQNAPRVNYISCWRVFTGREALGRQETSAQHSKKVTLATIISWAEARIAEQLLLVYTITRLTASIYF